MIDIHATDNSREIAEETASALREEGKQAAVVETVVLNLIAQFMGAALLHTTDRFVVVVETGASQ